MNGLLWVLQGTLAALFLVAGLRQLLQSPNPAPGNTYVTCLDLRTGEQVQRARSVAGKLGLLVRVE
ncbi:hypothetical protein ABGB18_46965 [Nonomuraea sp. B12E4]|uniref:hypothetical protein n=1 Tax=Nonomuraea sp. B12E4 TaxID=3153564 RepID=UPI00325D23FC